MTLHREGWFIIIIALVLFHAIMFGILLLPIFILIKIAVILFLAIILLLVIWFFRIPPRVIPLADDSIIYAPADGKIVVIEPTQENEYFKDQRMQISIFMSPLNVHQNIYPVGGMVSYTKYHKGDYLVAWHPKSSTQNERSTVVIKNPNGVEILVRQIAGAVARRICTYSKQGEVVQQGAELGFIKFGSRVDVFLPMNAKIECSINQISVNKRTVLAKLLS